MKNFLFALLILLPTTYLAGQVEKSIKGRLLGTESEPIQFAVLTIETENHTIKGLTNEQGFFYIPLNKDFANGRLTVQSLEIGKFFIKDLAWRDSIGIDLGDIFIKTNYNELSEFTVIGDIGVTAIAPQKIKYTANELISQAGGTAGDILKNMPSVAMGGSPNHNRDIRYRGLGNGYTAVLINGRNVGMNGNNRETVLDMIPASQIESIEILSQPGSDMQSDGMNGVVNIVLKKNSQLGSAGNLAFVADNLGGYNGVLSLSHGVGPFKFNGSFEKLSRQANKRDAGFQRKLDEAGNTKDFIPIDKLELKKFYNTTARFNIEYEAPKGWLLSTEYLYGQQLEDKDKNETNLTFNGFGDFKKGIIREEKENRNNHFHNVFFSSKKYFLNHQYLELSLNGNFSREIKSNLRNDFSANQTGVQNANQLPARQRELNSTGYTNFYPSVTYKKTWNQNWSLKSGYQGFLVDRESALQRENFNYGDNSWLLTTDNFNSFNLKERTHAFFLSSNWIQGNWKVTAGLRQEFTSLESQSLLDSIGTISNDYNLFLPNLQIIYNLGEKSYFTAGLGKRVRRPGYQDLNPFTEINDLTQIKQGNPNLKPETAFGYELGYFQQEKRFNFGINLFHRDIRNLIQKNISQQENGMILERSENISSAYAQGFELITAVKALDWWNLNLSYSKFNSKIEGNDQFEGDAIKDQTAWTGKVISDMILPWRTSLQITGNFIGPKTNSQETEEMIWYVDMGFEKKIKESGSLILRCTDVFDSLRKIKTKYTGNIIEEKTEDTPGQILSVGLRWNF